MNQTEDLGKLLLRLSLGIMILLHGISKIINGVGGISGMLERSGMPGELAYLAYVGEVLAPVLLIIGLWTRPAALLVAINMLVAIWLAHMSELFVISERGGGWALELQGMFLFTAIAIALLGAGSYSVAGRSGKWN